jgi:hypothetical protein
MPTPEETARRKALKQATRQAEREAIRSTLPLTPEQMRRLFDFVDEQLSAVSCDDILHNTLVFLGKKACLSIPSFAGSRMPAAIAIAKLWPTRKKSSSLLT